MNNDESVDILGYSVEVTKKEVEKNIMDKIDMTASKVEDFLDHLKELQAKSKELGGDGLNFEDIERIQKESAKMTEEFLELQNMKD